MDARLEPAWDVIASINGTNPDEYVIIGNHRDGWTGGGAADAVSGGSLLIEMAKAFGKLVEKGWKPRRTMYVSSDLTSILNSNNLQYPGLLGRRRIWSHGQHGVGRGPSP